MRSNNLIKAVPFFCLLAIIIINRKADFDTSKTRLIASLFLLGISLFTFIYIMRKKQVKNDKRNKIIVLSFSLIICLLIFFYFMYRKSYFYSGLI